MALGIFTCRRSLQCIAPNKRCRARQREKRVNEINAKTKAWGEKAALLARSLVPSTDQPLNTQDSSRTRCALGVLKFEVLRDLLVGLPRVVVLNVGVGIGASPLYSCTAQKCVRARKNAAVDWYICVGLLSSVYSCTT